MATTEPSTTDTDDGALADAQLLTALPSISARLQQRFPEASPAVIACCVDRAISLFTTARVRNFLPILIEREASDALRTTTPGLSRGDAAGPVGQLW